MHQTAQGQALSGLARGLLDRAAGAVPATEQETRLGWRLRYTDTSLWWVGAVMAHGGPDTRTLQDRVHAAEEFYAQRRAATRFQVCPGCPPGLDQILAARGYQRHSPMSLQVASAAQVAGRLRAPRLEVRLEEHPPPPWFEIWRAVQACDANLEAERRLLRRVTAPSCYVTVYLGDRPVSIGRAVAESGWTGVFGMATLPPARGQGAAKAALSALARWGAEARAPDLYLQLDHDNRPARQLYASAGFAEIFPYHYRTGPGRRGEHSDGKR